MPYPTLLGFTLMTLIALHLGCDLVVLPIWNRNLISTLTPSANLSPVSTLSLDSAFGTICADEIFRCTVGYTLRLTSFILDPCMVAFLPSGDYCLAHYAVDGSCAGGFEE